MKRTPFNNCWLAASLLLSLTIPATAQVVRMGGGLKPGFARPPLFLNLNPHDATSNYGPYSPMQIRHAYGIDTLLGGGTTGAGQTIAIVDAYGDPSIQSDLNNFCSYYGISSTTVKVLGTSTVNSGWGLETALDVEWAHAIAPNATIILSVANSASLGDLLTAVNAAVNAGASVVSMSWGAQESSGIYVYDSYFQTPGVTFVASSGDSGELAAPFEVEWPASSPYVVGVGGATLYLDGSGNQTQPETAWSGGGGGISAVYNVPTWQSGWQSTGKRTVPDVSYVADPNTGVGVAYGPYLYEVGGTSVGAPQWSALIALANQSRASKIRGNQDIYPVAGTAPNINSANFFDITSGSDGSDPDDLAGTGYDLVTGLGTPVANNLVPALAPQTADFTVSVTPGSESVTPGGTASYTVSVGALDGFNQAVSFGISSLPSGATATFTPPGVTGSGNSTLQITTTSGTTPVGTYTLTITGTSGTLTHSATVTLAVGNPNFTISATPSSRSIRHGNSANYTVTVAPSGGFVGTVTFAVSGLPSGASDSLSPVTVTGTGSVSSSLRISTSRSTPRGTYPITITGTCSSPTLTSSTSVTLTVD
jgi:subtilase family serine protease